MAKDEAMPDAPTSSGADGAAPAPDTKKETATPEPPSAASLLQANVQLIGKTVQSRETRVGLGRLMRQTAAVRKRLTPDVMAAFLSSTLPADNQTRSFLESHLSKSESAMEVENGHEPSAAENGAAAAATASEPPAEALPEVEAYAYLLALMHLLDRKQAPEAKTVADAALAFLAGFNRRTLDMIASRIYFYFSLAHERTDSLAAIRSASVMLNLARSPLLGLHRTAVLRHDEVGQEVLLNLLLRNYLHYNLYEQAEALRSKAQRPETARQQQQLARYLYYLGRIQTIQLDYTEAKDSLQQAARKVQAPQAAVGFRVVVQKWLVLVRLLLGEVPERQELIEADLERPLRPYFQLTNAVRVGDLTAFRAVAEEHAAVFRADRTQNVIVRLRHNVIRTGLRRINLAYSRIGLADVAAKLGLSDAGDVECIVAKAIKDGGVEAVIDHEGGFMASREVADVYATEEPQAAFHARVAFCLDIHNEAVKALRFDPAAHKQKVPETEEARQERVKAEAELAKALEEADEEDGL